MLILIDNYDSFTYNLVHYFEEIGQSVKVFRNDEITVEKIFKEDASRISPSITFHFLDGRKEKERIRSPKESRGRT